MFYIVFIYDSLNFIENTILCSLQKGCSVDKIQAFITVIGVLTQEGIWAFGVFAIAQKVVPFVKSRMAQDDELSSEDIFNMYG